MGEEGRGVSVACDPDLHLPPSLAGLSVASAINHCQVSFALVDGRSSNGSSSILYPCPFDSAASQVFHRERERENGRVRERGELAHTWVIGAACAFARQPKGASQETATGAAVAGVGGRGLG